MRTNDIIISGESMKIVVASDLHFLTSELTDHGEYYENMINNSDGKVMEYSEELVDAFIYQMIKEKPDAVILTGDLTFNGEKLSHESLSQKLNKLIEEGISVYVIPGNHDLNYPYAASFHGDSYTLTDSINEEEFKICYDDFGYEAALSVDDTSLSYSVDFGDAYRLIFVDVNGNDSPGTLTEGTLKWVEEELKEAKNENKNILAFSHQNLLIHSSLFTDGFVMRNASKLMKLYEEYGVLCNFSGHMHIQHIEESDGGIPEILTSALSITPMHYGVIEIGETGFQYEVQSVDVESWAADIGIENEDLLNFSEYAKEFFWKGSYSQAYDAVSEDDDADEMARFIADLNLAYFTGRMDFFTWDDTLADKWKKTGTYWSIYITSIEPYIGANYGFFAIPERE